MTDFFKPEDFESEDFYNVAQRYRNAPPIDQQETIASYLNLKIYCSYIANAKLQREGRVVYFSLNSGGWFTDDRANAPKDMFTKQALLINVNEIEKKEPCKHDVGLLVIERRKLPIDHWGSHVVLPIKFGKYQCKLCGEHVVPASWVTEDEK